MRFGISCGAVGRPSIPPTLLGVRRLFRLPFNSMAFVPRAMVRWRLPTGVGDVVLGRTRNSNQGMFFIGLGAEDRDTSAFTLAADSILMEMVVGLEEATTSVFGRSAETNGVRSAEPAPKITTMGCAQAAAHVHNSLQARNRVQEVHNNHHRHSKLRKPHRHKAAPQTHSE